MRNVRLFTALVGPSYSASFGDIITMQDDEAKRFVDSDQAEYTEDPAVLSLVPEAPVEDIPAEKPKSKKK